MLLERCPRYRHPCEIMNWQTGVHIRTVDDLINGSDEILATGIEHSVTNEIQSLGAEPTTLERSRSRLVSRNAHLSSSPPRGSPPAIRRNRSLGNACRTNSYINRYLLLFSRGTWKILIASGQKDPKSGESYLSACTSNIILTVCGRFQTAQAVLLRDAYVETLSDMPPKSTGYEVNHQLNGPDYQSLEDGPFWPGQTDRFDVSHR
ncbi:uncharacterized protein DEA37_0001008 [Paragonimus westermani]|uniref:Uncharacterized protein n=1 Tax=Paragonimus westermani TaxID=34504 RepID=A0A5J4NVR2_9TREM|nr:uncharacterized protein DEA37_0001008 [Paragonimus westermani]